MIKFFRKIRQKLLAQNKLGQYLKYAVGEIILVVIGILIALQINNWNEARKERATESKLYGNLLTSLEADSTDIVHVLEAIDAGIEAQEMFILQPSEEIIKNHSIEEIEELVSNTGRVGLSFFPRYSVYYQITNNGYLPIIRSEEIKQQLVQLYDRTYHKYEHVDAAVEQKNQFHLDAFVRGELSVFPKPFNLHPQDGFNEEVFNVHYEELAKECRKIYSISKSAKRTLEEVQQEVNALLVLIRIELDK